MITKLYGENRKTYFIADKSKVKLENVISYACKTFHVSRNHIKVSNAENDINGTKNDYLVNTKIGKYWCVERVS